MFLNFNKRDRIILGAAGFLVLIALYFLYDDSLLLRFDNNSDQPKIGKISTLENDVRYKLSKRLTWKSARNEESVHLGDSIFTGKESSATVEFDDGRSLIIQPNSLVVITTVGDQMKLDLKFGSFGGTLDGCIKVDVQGRQVDLCGTKSKVEVNAKGDVKVKQGSVKVANKKIVAVEKEIIAWNKKPEPQILHSENNKDLTMSWSPKNPYSRYRVQFSKDGKFKNIPAQDLTSDLSITTKNYPRNGEYFVRIQAEDATNQVVAMTDPVKVKFLEIQAPRILTPLADERFNFSSENEGQLKNIGKVKVSWDSNIKNGKYKLEIAENEDFTKLAVNHETSEKTFETPSLAAGTYFARVQETQLGHQWSKVIAFQVNIQGPRLLSPPQLLTKQIKHVAPSDRPPVIQWKTEESVEKYIVETSTSEEFPASSTASYEVTTPKAPLTVINPGKTFFRVSSVNKNGRRSPSSEVGTLNTFIERPILKPVPPLVALGKTPDDPGAPVDMKLSWSDLKLPGSYEIQISDNREFKNPIKYQSTTPESVVSIPKPGDYNWRVRALNNQGRPITRFSKPDKIKYDIKVPLEKPALIEPSAKMTLFFQKEAPPYIWLEWKSVRQAVVYSVEVASDPNFNQIVYQAKSTSSRHLIKQALGNGKFYWRTQASGDDGRISHWSDPREMSVFSGQQSTDRLPAGQRK